MAGSTVTSIVSGGSPIGEPLTLFIVQMLLVVITCRLLGYLFKYIKQPTVIAEVITGIILGPSVFGHIPKYMDTLFPAASIPIFNVIANVGLILFMFMVGLEIDTKLMSKNVGSALIISITAMVTPFLLGLAAAYAIYIKLVDDSVSFASFLLFVGVAMSITAFPVLARILTELKLLDTRVGNMALSSAAVDDVVAWCLLALVVSIARASKPLAALWTFFVLIGFILFMMFIVRPFLASIAKRRAPHERHLSLNFIVFILISVFVCSWFTEIIGVHAIFGSFILGVVVPRNNRFAAALIERIEDLVVVIFVPLYFTFSGLRTNIGSISSSTAWGLTILVIVTAVVGKIVGGTLAARFLKNSWRESFTIGILMNTKGLVELIVLNVGLDVGVLNTEVFTMFVIMALVTTCMTTPLLYFVYLRKRREAREITKSSLYTVFLSVPKLDDAHLLVTISKLFTHVKDTFKLKALLLSEISDRPSSYFFSEYYHMIRENSFTADGKKRKALLSDMKTNAKLSGMDVQTKTIASASIPTDLIEYCDSHFADVLLCELHYEVDEVTPAPPSQTEEVSISDLQESQTQPKTKPNFRQSFSTGVSGFVDKNLHKVLKFDSGQYIVKHAVDHAKCAIGVLIHKKEGGKLKNVKRIAFVYMNKSYELRALKTVMRLPEDIEVTVLALDETFRNVSEDKRDVKFVPSSTPDIDVVEEAKVGYDLIVMGMQRSATGLYDSDAIKESSVPVLVIYSELAPRSSNLSSERSSDRNSEVFEIGHDV